MLNALVASIVFGPTRSESNGLRSRGGAWRADKAQSARAVWPGGQAKVLVASWRGRQEVERAKAMTTMELSFVKAQTTITIVCCGWPASPLLDTSSLPVYLDRVLITAFLAAKQHQIRHTSFLLIPPPHTSHHPQQSRLPSHTPLVASNLRLATSASPSSAANTAARGHGHLAIAAAGARRGAEAALPRRWARQDGRRPRQRPGWRRGSEVG